VSPASDGATAQGTSPAEQAPSSDSPSVAPTNDSARPAKRPCRLAVVHAAARVAAAGRQPWHCQSTKLKKSELVAAIQQARSGSSTQSDPRRRRCRLSPRSSTHPQRVTARRRPQTEPSVGTTVVGASAPPPAGSPFRGRISERQRLTALTRHRPVRAMSRGGAERPARSEPGWRSEQPEPEHPRSERPTPGQ